MAARLGALALVTSLLIGCTAAQVSPSPTAEPASSPSSIPSPSAAPSATPSPAATPSPSPTPSPSASAGSALSWLPMGVIKGTNHYYNEIVGFAAGYVVIGDSSVAFSADGKEWTSTALPFHPSKDEDGKGREYHANRIATDGTTVVIVGGYEHTPCRPSNGGAGGGPDCLTAPVSWTTTDGATWRTSDPWRGPSAPKPYKQGLEFSTVWAVPSGGWDAAADYIAGESGGAGSIFHSADGLVWTPLAAAPSTVLKSSPSTSPPEFWGPAAAASTGKRLVAGTWYVQAGEGADPVTDLFASADGASWKAVSSFPGTRGDVERIAAPSSADGGLWMVAGEDAAGQPTIWTSPDLATWSVVHLPTGAPQGGGSVEDLDVTTLGLVALGSASDTPGGDVHPATWVAVDAAHWTMLDTNGAVGGPDVAAAGPAGVVGLTTGGDMDVPAPIWTLK